MDDAQTVVMLQVEHQMHGSHREWAPVVNEYPAREGRRPAQAAELGSYLRRLFRSAMTSTAAFRPGAPVTPPPGCAPEPARYRPSTGIR